MSSTGNKDLIARSEKVDSAFTSFWSNSINLRCGTIFFNPDLPNDVFFDKLTNLTCLDDETLGDSLQLFETYRTIPYVYTLNNPEFDKKLIDRNFKLYDIQHVLIRNQNSAVTSNVNRVSSKESMTWSEIFCRAYDCYEWIAYVDKIVKKSLDSIEYYLDESSGSCVALYESNSLLGLYCLGTLPNMRKKGLATSLIEFASNQTKQRDLEFLMLETYQKDKLLDFYLNLGFKEIYQKKLYTI